MNELLRLKALAAWFLWILRPAIRRRSRSCSQLTYVRETVFVFLVTP